MFQAGVRNTADWALVLTRVQFAFFNIVTVLTLSTIIGATAADTFERLNRRSDLEWKFERAKLIRNVVKTSPMPSPFNMAFKAYIYFKTWVRRGKLVCTTQAALYLALEEEGGGMDEEMGFDQEVQNHYAGVHWSKLRVLMRRKSRLDYLRSIPMPKSAHVKRKTGKSKKDPTSTERIQLQLKDVLDWSSVVARYRELGREEHRDDQYIKELGCYLSELEEWQADMWLESCEVEEDEEREIFRNWIIEEFKEVIKS